MSKADWIRAQYEASSEKNIPLFASGLNTKSLVDNPAPQPTVLKVVDFSTIGLLAADRQIIQNNLQGTYQSLLTNINKGNIPAIQDDVEVICLNVSADAVTKITAALQEAVVGMPDPNWQSQLWLSPAEIAGYGEVLVNEVVEALEN